MRHATEAYLASEDAVAQWLDECCAVDKTHQGRSAELFKNWKAWAEASGEAAGSQKQFTHSLEGRGFIRFKGQRYPPGDVPRADSALGRGLL